MTHEEAERRTALRVAFELSGLSCNPCNRKRHDFTNGYGDTIGFAELPPREDWNRCLCACGCDAVRS